MFYERHMVHSAFYQVRHIQEADAVAQESKDGYFIRGIQHTGEVSAFEQGVRSQGQVAECLDIRLFESEGVRLLKIITRKFILNTPRQSQALFNRNLHIPHTLP